VDELFEIDDGALGQQVIVGLRQGLVINPKGNAFSITVVGVLREIAPRSILLETSQTSIVGPAGRVTLPKSVLMFVNCPSRVSLIPSSLMPPET